MEIARLVEYHRTGGHGSVRNTLEAVEHFLFPLSGGRDGQRQGNGEEQADASYARRTLLEGHGAVQPPGWLPALLVEEETTRRVGMLSRIAGNVHIEVGSREGHSTQQNLQGS